MKAIWEKITYELGDTPLTFEQVEAHCALGGLAAAIRPEDPGQVYAMFGPWHGPMFEGLWTGCVWYPIRR